MEERRYSYQFCKEIVEGLRQWYQDSVHDRTTISTSKEFLSLNYSHLVDTKMLYDLYLTWVSLDQEMYEQGLTSVTLELFLYIKLNQI